MDYNPQCRFFKTDVSSFIHGARLDTVSTHVIELPYYRQYQLDIDGIILYKPDCFNVIWCTLRRCRWFILTFICLMLWTIYYLSLDCLGSGWGFTWSLLSPDPRRSCRKVWQTFQEPILTLLCPAWVFVRNAKYSHPMLNLASVTTCYAVIKFG